MSATAGPSIPALPAPAKAAREEAASTAGPAPAPAVAPHIAHAVSAGRLQADRARRMLGTVADTVRLLATAHDPATFDELAQLQAAVAERVRKMSTGWAQAWSEWYRYASETGGMNTLAKLSEREANIVNQATQLLGSQVTDLIVLQENIEVSYAYWLSQKLAKKP